MSARGRGAGRSTSLDKSIGEVEQRLADRRGSIGVRYRALGVNLREKLGSPIAFLIAAGTGFALGQFSKRKSAKSDLDSGTGRGRVWTFAMLLDAFSLASTVMAMLPVLRHARAHDAAGTDNAP